MPTTYGKIQTMARAYEQICAGEIDPWIALGNFRNAWYGYAKDIRPDLVSEPIAQPVHETDFTRRWGAFCAASVEFLCDRYDVPCPQWALDPRYILPNPWWSELRAHDLADREKLMKITPQPFTKRNIFCGNRLYQNKYEMSAWTQEARAKGITDPGEVWKYARAKEIAIHGG
jgi:hypothetical protein